MTEIPSTQVPGLYHRRIGDLTVTAVSDGYYDTPVAALVNIAPETAARTLTEAWLPVPPRVSINCFLVRSGNRVALIDTGAGDTMGPTLGKLPQTLAALGMTRDDIDTILLTHMHPDHSNGLTGADDKAFFSNAELVVSAADVRHWHDDAARTGVDPVKQRRYFDEARRQFAPYRDRCRDARGEVFPGVTAFDLSGHTPGHTGYLIGSGRETLLIWGDICHVPALQMPDPNVCMAFDTDAAAAARTRARVLDQAATDGLLVAGMHLHFPGFIHVARRGAGYEAIPEPWQFDLT